MTDHHEQHCHQTCERGVPHGLVGLCCLSDYAQMVEETRIPWIFSRASKLMTKAALVGTAESNCQHMVYKEWEKMD